MKTLALLVLIIALLGPRPPLLPSKPGPATYRQYKATCSTTYYPTTYPRACGWHRWLR